MSFLRLPQEYWPLAPLLAPTHIIGHGKRGSTQFFPLRAPVEDQESSSVMCMRAETVREVDNDHMQVASYCPKS